MTAGPGPVAFNLDGTLLQGDTVCEGLARRRDRVAEMAALERLTGLDDIHASREVIARW